MGGGCIRIRNLQSFLAGLAQRANGGSARKWREMKVIETAACVELRAASLITSLR
ncbi:UNVERIFIED_CONTAM: hypothetical protein FKN15_028794 [Acipenser sinensis]